MSSSMPLVAISSCLRGRLCIWELERESERAATAAGRAQPWVGPFPYISSFIALISVRFFMIQLGYVYLLVSRHPKNGVHRVSFQLLSN